MRMRGRDASLGAQHLWLAHCNKPESEETTQKLLQSLINRTTMSQNHHHLLLLVVVVLMTSSSSRASFEIELGKRGCYDLDFEVPNNCVRFLALNYHDGCKLTVKGGCAPFVTRMTFHHSYSDKKGKRPGMMVVGVPCTNESLGLSTNCEWGSYDNASSLGELFGLYGGHTKSKLEEIRLPFNTLKLSDIFPSENDTSSLSSNETVSEEVSEMVSSENDTSSLSSNETVSGRRRRRTFDNHAFNDEDVNFNFIDSGENLEEKESSKWADVAIKYLKLSDVFKLPSIFGSKSESQEDFEDGPGFRGSEEPEG
ncbi:uncharacterized protein LOC143017556 [Oratosquilla oratoria]|uniref:uncharacterized protein LOC143017556 n=1 Tax=Oratosquilla oratoria TaxID=337810 RepID=UPI003F759B89